MNSVLDAVVIGAGPAGLTASIYLARAGLKPLVLEKLVPGGQAATTDVVENYPGFDEPVGGFDLAETMRRQAEKFGAEIRTAEATALEAHPSEHGMIVRFGEGHVNCRTVIAATGARHRRLGVPGEERFWGKGISCCATCDGMFYRGKHVVVVGGGDTAVKETLFLTRFAEKITLLHRRDRLRAAKALQDRLLGAGDQVSFAWNTTVEEILGGERVEAVCLRDVRSGQQRKLECDGVFVFVGFTPNTEHLRGVVKLDERGHVITDERMATSVPGIYAAGDCRRRPFRQIVTACGDGAVAAQSAGEFLEEAVPEVTDTDLDRISRRKLCGLCVCPTGSPDAQGRVFLLERLAERFAGRVAFCRLDPAAGTITVKRYSVRSLPTLLILRGGKELRRLEGALDECEATKALEEALVPSGPTGAG